MQSLVNRAEGAATTATNAVTVTAQLPTLGSELAGGKYAGTTTDHTGATYALIVLDETPNTEDKTLTWADALAWAESLSAQLPSRAEAAMLFANLKIEFEEDAHWTRDEYSAPYAWCQDFYDGLQYVSRKSNELCARAVRRLPVNPSIL